MQPIATLSALATLVGGAALLYLGANWLVRGATGLALALRVSPFVVGVVVVGFGTSVPELVVSLRAAAGGDGGIALGNVVGSNLANLGLVLGVSAWAYRVHVPRSLRNALVALAVSTGALVWVTHDDVVSRGEGAMLLLIGLVWIIVELRRGTTARGDVTVLAAEESVVGVSGVQDEAPIPRVWLLPMALGGLCLVALGGHGFVTSASWIARGLGGREELVGLTLVALGTSLPEFVTSLVAARRGHGGVAIGNVVGSNIFNVFVCLGAAGLTRALRTPFDSARGDLASLTVVTLGAIVFLRTERELLRWEGAALVGAYAATIVVAIVGL